MMNPYISRQLADQRRRDMLDDAQRHRLVRQCQSETVTARDLTQRLRRRLRAIARLHPAVQG